MKYTLLWTDFLIYLLVFSLIIFFWYTRHRRDWLQTWREVFRSKIAVSSLMILSVYLFITVLDSIHFIPVKNTARNGYQMVSLLDQILSPLNHNIEKTYSAPFATHLYVKEMIPVTQGAFIRDYPRLSYVPTETENSEEKKSHIFNMIKHAIFKAFLLWVFFNFLLLFFYKKQGENFFHPLQDKNKAIFLTVSITAFLIFVGIFTSYDLSREYHILGTDKVGNDVFYESIKSIRTGMVIGTLTTLVMLPFAIYFGLVSGFLGGRLDDFIQFIYTTLSSIPSVLLISAFILSLQIFIANHPEWFTSLLVSADARLLGLCLILGITSWTSLCRLLRGETLKIREMEYIQSAKALGARMHHILFAHVLPNVMHIVLIACVLDFSALVLAEAVLSYVGVGVDPSTYSWGNMINSARLEMAREPIVWWPLLAAFVLMFVLVLSANLFADVVRRAFDPRMRTLGGD